MQTPHDLDHDHESPPTNGKVTIVPGVSTIAAKSLQPASVRRCAGKSVPGNQIRYRSNPGFHGTDSLGYTVRYGNGQRGSTPVTIDVHQPLTRPRGLQFELSGSGSTERIGRTRSPPT